MRSLAKIFSPILGIVGLGFAIAAFVPLIFAGNVNQTLHNAAIGWFLLYAAYRGLFLLMAEPVAQTKNPDIIPAHPVIEGVPATPWDSVIRSLLFSGVGQIHNGQILKGVLLLPVSASFFILCLFFMMSFADVDRHGLFPYDRLFLYMAVLGCIWLYAIIDAYIVAARMILSRQQVQRN